MSVKALKKEFVSKYLTEGESKFYRYLLFDAINKLIHIESGTYNGISPEMELIKYYEQFITLYRREGEETYLDLSRIFRKAAHKIYRVLLKKKLIEKNLTFLNLV